MNKMDSHIHSEYSPDSKSKLEDIFRVAKKRNINIIAISDHNTVDGSKKARELTKKDDDFLVIPSIEISSLEGHILGFGCEENIKRDLPAGETIDLVHDQGGLAIIPHPYCFYRHGLFCKADYKDLKVDAIETKNARFIVGYCNNKAKNLSIKENLPALGASDAHYYKFVGDCYSNIDCEMDIDSVLKAVKNRKVEALGKGTSNIRLSKYLLDYKILKKI